jgi:hypothetical protein
VVLWQRLLITLATMLLASLVAGLLWLALQQKHSRLSEWDHRWENSISGCRAKAQSIVEAKEVACGCL